MNKKPPSISHSDDSLDQSSENDQNTCALQSRVDVEQLLLYIRNTPKFPYKKRPGTRKKSTRYRRIFF